MILFENDKEEFDPSYSRSFRYRVYLYNWYYVVMMISYDKVKFQFVYIFHFI